MSAGAAPLLYTHPVCLGHRPDAEHPESPERLDAILSALPDLPRHEAPLATQDDLALAHTKTMIAHVFDLIPKTGIWALDGDTIVSPKSGEAALRAAGAALAATDAVIDGKASFAFCAMRPPGHHATRERPGGFCLFNNVAIAALHALERRGLKRVAIVDFDVHHGNGTQDIFWDDPRVMFVSSHQSPLYPGTGSESEKGAHDTILNMPLKAGTDGAVLRALYESQARPRLEAFAPEMIFVSAGFDAHRDDPLANIDLVEEDYAWLGTFVRKMAERSARGRVVATLEGGYNLDALAASTAAFVGAFGQ